MCVYLQWEIACECNALHSACVCRRRKSLTFSMYFFSLLDSPTFTNITMQRYTPNIRFSRVFPTRQEEIKKNICIYWVTTDFTSLSLSRVCTYTCNMKCNFYIFFRETQTFFHKQQKIIKETNFYKKTEYVRITKFVCGEREKFSTEIHCTIWCKFVWKLFH